MDRHITQIFKSLQTSAWISSSLCRNKPGTHTVSPHAHQGMRPLSCGPGLFRPHIAPEPRDLALGTKHKGCQVPPFPVPASQDGTSAFPTSQVTVTARQGQEAQPSGMRTHTHLHWLTAWNSLGVSGKTINQSTID